jgi:glycosyltransferase involved in cell wall biosynthesis
MKHVLVLNQFALPPSEAGGTRHIDLFSRVQGWTPLIIAGNRNHGTQEVFDTDDKRFRLTWLPPQHGGGLARIIGWIIYAVQAFFLTITRRQLDLVYGSSPHLLAPFAGLAAARVRRVPFVLEVRDLWPESIVAAGKMTPGSVSHRVLTSLERLLVTQAERIVVVTSGWEDHFAQLGVPVSKITVIPNGTEASDFIVSETRETLRAAYRISGFTAIFAGSHGPKDGIDLILDAAAKTPEINFLLVGAGASKRQAEARIRQQNITNLEFRTPIPKTELARLLGACDVGIHAVTPLSVFEKGMSPNKLFDYMASGLPVVSNAEHALRDVIVDGECGPLGGSDSLVDCLRRVYEADETTRAEWGRRGRQLVVERFSRSAAAARLTAILNSRV